MPDLGAASRHDNPDQWVSGGHEKFETPMRSAAIVSGSCKNAIHHFANLLWHGWCACWDEGRNRHPYWGWKS